MLEIDADLVCEQKVFLLTLYDTSHYDDFYLVYRLDEAIRHVLANLPLRRAVGYLGSAASPYAQDYVPGNALWIMGTRPEPMFASFHNGCTTTYAQLLKCMHTPNC